jgi:hypothetical protein
MNEFGFSGDMLDEKKAELESKDQKALPAPKEEEKKEVKSAEAKKSD